jgi:FAD-linked sulfhydryl oxidase
MAPPRVWGPKWWRWLHITAINYPQNPTRRDAHEAANRVHHFIANLPCVMCRRHATGYTMSNPPKLVDNQDFQIWVWRFHNSVNARLGKKICEYDDYLSNYSDEICLADWQEADWQEGKCPPLPL